MIVIADSGSTKTNWLISDSFGKKVWEFKTIGFNPYFVTKEEVENCLFAAFPDAVNTKDVSEVFFYGSGCSNCDNFQHLESALKLFYPNALISIYSDMFGTARAILKRETGIAAILGTGSNSCFYNGEIITQNAISLGYVLGDEGSGAYIGKLFVKRYLEQKFDTQLTDKILKETGENITSILSALYQKEHPNRFLASFCLFMNNNIQHPQIREVVFNAFDDFFKNYVEIYPNYQNYKLGFCGSIAFNFKDILFEVAANYGFDVSKIVIINEILYELLKFHTDNKNY